jgi:DNA-binding transcriptional LysR family regulator
MFMALDSNQLEAFYAVSSNGNFTKAAGQLGITQSALSQRILNLEDALGTTLFIRDRAGLRLTEVAQNLLRFCRLKNDLESEFLSDIKTADSIAGVLRIGGFSSVMRSVVLPALAPMLKKFNQVQLQIHTVEMQELLPLLKSGEVDFIISDLRYEREELESRELGTETNVLIEEKKYSGPDIYLDHDEKDPTTINYLRLTKAKLTQPRRHYLDDIYGLIEGVKIGLGRAVVPAHLIRNEKTLRVLRPKETLDVQVYLHYFKQPFYSKFHQLVVKELTENAPALLK